MVSDGHGDVSLFAALKNDIHWSPFRILLLNILVLVFRLVVLLLRLVAQVNVDLALLLNHL